MARTQTPSEVQKAIQQLRNQRLSLSNVAARDFEWLCKKGCDPKVLGEFLIWWAANPVILLPADAGKERREAYQIHLRPLDAWNTAMRDVRPAGVRAFRRKLERQIKVLRKLHAQLTDLEALHRRVTERYPLFMLGKESLLHAADFLEVFNGPVLREFIERLTSYPVGPKAELDRTRLENRLLEYIREKTGSRWASRLCSILSSLDPKWKRTPEAWRERRYRAQKSKA